jgi:hypothetical protein
MASWAGKPLFVPIQSALWTLLDIKLGHHLAALCLIIKTSFVVTLVI